MNIQLFERRMQQRIEQERQNFGSLVLSGGCETFDDYRYHVGVLAGLEMARMFVDEIHKDISGD